MRVFALLMLVAAPLVAQDSTGRATVAERLKGSRWQAYAEKNPAPSEETYEFHSFDATRVEVVKNAHFRVWVREDYVPRQSLTFVNSVRHYDWLINQMEVNCRTLSTVILRQLLYTEDNAEPTWDWKATPGINLTWETMVPDTTGESKLKLLCGQLKRPSKR